MKNLRVPFWFGATAMMVLVVPLATAQDRGALEQRGGTSGDIRTIDGRVLQIDLDRNLLVIANARDGSDARFPRHSKKDRSDSAKDESSRDRARRDDTGREVTIQVPEDTDIYLDHEHVDLGDLKKGMVIRVYAATILKVIGGPDMRGKLDPRAPFGGNRSDLRDMGGTIDRRGRTITRRALRATRIEAASARTDRK